MTIETMDRIKWHTSPGLRSRTLDILLYFFQFFFVQAHTNNFIVIPALFVPASLTSVLPSQFDAWPKAVSGQHLWGRLAGFWPAYPVQVLAQQDTLSLCQLHSNQPPFKLLALPPRPSGRSTTARQTTSFIESQSRQEFCFQPHQRLQGCPGLLHHQSLL